MILLDTHAWTRWLHPEMGQSLPSGLRAWLEATHEDFGVSIISCLEIAQLVKRGRLILPLRLPTWFDAALDGSGIACLPLTPRILHTSTTLPDIHRDPADRIIISTAQTHGAVLITADTTIQKYPFVRCVWDAPPILDT
ncbi:MAG: type II toxin-antitoxin system VapC family toxin [Magnetococcales bacterium]|nr:type II toxin-antitoxin system VapC family toxin [Magnetococcales bacterium]